MSQEGILAEAITRILELSDVQRFKIHGIEYASADLHKVPMPCATPLKINTLSGLVEYCETEALQKDLRETDTPIRIHIESEVKVSVITDLDHAYRSRECLAVASPPVTESFPYERWVSIEEFIIALQTNFVRDEQVLSLLRLLSNLKDERVVQSLDDGMSQSVLAKVGISLAEQVNVPNPVTLRPYRTFLDIEQSEIPFLFRLKSQDKGLPEAYLREAGGGMWRLGAIERIRAYLETRLDVETIIIA